MEANAKDMRPDPEWDAFVAEVEARMPASDDDLVAARDARIDYLLEKMGDIRAEQRWNREVAQRRIDVIQKWLDDENGKLDRQYEHVESRLRPHLPNTPEQFAALYGDRAKSRSLPNGKFGFRRSADRVEITDKDAALAFARTNGLEVKVAESVSKTTLKNHAKATGEFSGQGWELVEGADELFVDPVEG